MKICLFLSLCPAVWYISIFQNWQVINQFNNKVKEKVKENLTARFYWKSQDWKYKKRAGAIYEQFHKTTHRISSPVITVFQTENLTLNNPPLCPSYYVTHSRSLFEIQTKKRKTQLPYSLFDQGVRTLLLFNVSLWITIKATRGSPIHR